MSTKCKQAGPESGRPVSHIWRRSGGDDLAAALAIFRLPVDFYQSTWARAPKPLIFAPSLTLAPFMKPPVIVDWS